jgi:hypothetical protein
MGTAIVLSILYFLVVSPIALVLRLLRSDPMRRTFDSKVASYRIASRGGTKDNLRSTR